MKYIKLFNNHVDYNTYMNSQDKVLPNVSYCENENEVHYNPIEARLVAKFNVTSTSSATNIMYSSATSQFTEIEIDGVVHPSIVSSYTFDTTGEHTVKYTLADPTTIGNGAFSQCTSLTSVTIPDSVTTIGSAFVYCTSLTNITIPNSVISIGEQAFNGCYSLTNITIPNSVTSIGAYAFNNCTGLTSVIVQATTPPTLGSNAFNYTNNCPIYVPSASVNTYKTATDWSSFASRIQAIQ